MRHLLILLCFPVSVLALDSRFEQWAKIQTPLPGPARVIGYYSAGCLAGAEKLTGDGPGFSVMRPSRNRFYAHPEMKTYLSDLVRDLRAQKLPLLLIGDAGPPRGGPMVSGHNSHQGGLDVDLWLRMSRKRPTKSEKEKWAAPKFVRERKKLLSTWSSRQVKLIATAAAFANVERIFVAPAIKKYFCDNFGSAPWLYRLRAWWGHEEHIHVRLKCPADSPQCQAQTPPLDSANPGCGDELAWWFSKEADDDWQKIIGQPGVREFPALPAECDVMVQSDLRRLD